MKKKLATTLLLFFLLFPMRSQVKDPDDGWSSKLEAYVNNWAPEKLYVHTDKEFYAINDTIWFKAYLINGVTHTASDKSKVLYVELLDSKDSVVVNRKLYIEGYTVYGDIRIGDSIPAGDYRLRAYTKYMLNDKNLALFQKKISVFPRPQRINFLFDENPSNAANWEQRHKKDVTYSSVHKPNVQFFPEGGNLVAGLESVLGLKIANDTGKGIALKGNIIDQNGGLVAPFETHDLGLGKVSIIPKTDLDYYAEIYYDGISYKYRLPEVLKNGCVVQVINKGSQIVVKVSTNSESGLNETLLLGHLRGEVFLKHNKDYGNKRSYAITFPTATLSDGIAHFTLFNRQGEPICERLTFIANPENDTKITLKTDRSYYGYREKVEMDLALLHNHETDLKGNFSLNVSFEKALGENTANIKNWILLDSDLGNALEDPYSFYGVDSIMPRSVVDIWMLTHRWRRFGWESLMTEDFNKMPEFLPEKGIMISGRVTPLNTNGRPQKTLTTLNIWGPNIYQEKKETDAQGRFSFGPLVLMDSATAIMTVSKLDKKISNGFGIHLDPFPLPVAMDSLIRGKLQQKNLLPPKEPVREYRNIVSDLKNTQDVIALSEVVVQTRRKTNKEQIEEELNKRTIYGSAQNRLFPDSIHGLTTSATIFDLISRVAGVQVLGTSVRIRGVNSLGVPKNPLFTIDGVPTTTDFIQGMTVNDVLFVDVLKGNEAAIYGVRGANGVIAIYTDRGQKFESTRENYPGVANFVVPGFYRAKEFHAPDYESKNPEHKTHDYRTTLYWNPEIGITKGTPIKLYFYTGDMPGKFTINIEGMTTDGNPVSGRYSFNVSE